MAYKASVYDSERATPSRLGRPPQACFMLLYVAYKMSVVALYIVNQSLSPTLRDRKPSLLLVHTLYGDVSVHNTDDSAVIKSSNAFFRLSKFPPRAYHGLTEGK
jgi:hypothetical protein